ncbi:MAG: hypothetical protein ABIQ16_09535 [Polyangiaceae bacterium]
MRRGLFRLALAASGALAALVAPSDARAFEREWHVGGGVGVTAYPHYYSAGPALGLNAAYGVSDVFDLKFELLGSLNSYVPPFSKANAAPARNPPQSERAEPWSAVAGLSYKLDILQWIPYGALLLGYQHIGGRLPLGEPFRRDDALAAIVLGLDYAATRNFGLGASVRSDILLTSSERGAAFTPMLRAEYHWGF